MLLWKRNMKFGQNRTGMVQMQKRIALALFLNCIYCTMAHKSYHCVAFALDNRDTETHRKRECKRERELFVCGVNKTTIVNAPHPNIHHMHARVCNTKRLIGSHCVRSTKQKQNDKKKERQKNVHSPDFATTKLAFITLPTIWANTSAIYAHPAIHTAVMR